MVSHAVTLSFISARHFFKDNGCELEINVKIIIFVREIFAHMHVFISQTSHDHVLFMGFLSLSS